MNDLRKIKIEILIKPDLQALKPDAPDLVSRLVVDVAGTSVVVDKLHTANTVTERVYQVVNDALNKRRKSLLSDAEQESIARRLEGCNLWHNWHGNNTKVKTRRTMAWIDEANNENL